MKKWGMILVSAVIIIGLGGVGWSIFVHSRTTSGSEVIRDKKGKSYSSKSTKAKDKKRQPLKKNKLRKRWILKRLSGVTLVVS